MLAYTRSLRQETREYGVKVIDLIVGATETEIWSEESRTELGQRMMSAQNIADLVRELVGNFGNERMMIEEVTIRPQLGDL
jgi:short-subunit dehydrogenase